MNLIDETENNIFFELNFQKLKEIYAINCVIEKLFHLL